jgi:predicted nucleotidyltransferase
MTAVDVLDPRQRAVAERALDEESAARRHLVVALSGGHAYGFPSPDSDLDLKAIHVAPTEALLGLSPPAANAPDRIEVIDGVEIDYSSNELQPVLVGMLQGNGNFLERVLSRFVLRTSPEHASLRPLVARSLSRRLHRHYRGFATGQLREWEKDGFRSAKKLLYVLRTTLTGTHALLTGEVETDVTLLLDAHGFSAARELVEAKRRGERSELAPEVAERWRKEVGRSFEVLDAALARSVLPEEPPNVPEIEAWLVELRRAGLAQPTPIRV